MENLKIKVNTEAESKEAQELFFELGYKWFSGGNQVQHLKHSSSSSSSFGYLVAWSSGCFTDVIQCGCGSEDAKEITLPQLRDMIVLKRNDVGDANYKTNYGTQCYITEEDVYAFQDNKWFLSAMQHKDILDMIKPIEKPMKEYLRKNNDGEYILEVTDEREAQEPHAKHWIEVPKGCDYLISVFGVNSFIDSDMFAKFKTKNVLWSRKPMKEYLDPENGYKLNLTDRPFFDWIEIPEGANFAWKSDGKYVFFTALEMGYRDASVVWSRHTQPEELPFIDDDPSQSLNDQYAEIEKVRQSHRTASEIADSALKHIRERAETYDQPTGERSAAKTAKAFNAITGKDITESEVWLLLQLLKDVRQWSREDYHQDSAEDCIAYAALKAESLEGGE